MNDRAKETLGITIAALTLPVVMGSLGVLLLTLGPEPRDDRTRVANQGLINLVGVLAACTLVIIILVGITAWLVSVRRWRAHRHLSRELRAGANASWETLRTDANRVSSGAQNLIIDFFGTRRARREMIAALKLGRTDILRAVILGVVIILATAAATGLAHLSLQSVLRVSASDPKQHAELLALAGALCTNLRLVGWLGELWPVILIALAYRRGWKRLHSKKLCRKCDYNLHGNVSGRCPECGTRIPYARV